MSIERDKQLDRFQDELEKFLWKYLSHVPENERLGIRGKLMKIYWIGFEAQLCDKCKRMPETDG